MHIRIIKIGKLASEYEALAQKFYTFLLPNKLDVVEVKSSRKGEQQSAMSDEAALLKSKIDNDWPTVILTEHGQQFDSPQFAEWIEAKTAQTGRLQIVIGGAFGFPKDFLDEFSKNNQLGLGKLTLPHDLAFITLLEQIYRAITIISGKKYHY